MFFARFGTVGGVSTGITDPRHFLITGRYGFTPTHIDYGVQCVLYHVVSGVNKFLGIPRVIAAVLWALQEFDGELAETVKDIEADVLQRLLELGKPVGFCRSSLVQL